MKIQSLFVTGTDTEVGKTLVTALLALHFGARGTDVGIMKPFASGCAHENGVLVSQDAQFLKDVCELDEDLDLINPARWEEALAPLVAIRRALDTQNYWPRVLESYDALAARHEIVLVEGVGGVLAPLGERDGKILTCLDLMNTLALPVVVVARRTLGTINHTLLTIETLRNANLEVAGLVFCDAVPVEENDIAAQTSTSIIAEISGAKILGVVPHLENLSREILRAAASDYLNI